MRILCSRFLMVVAFGLLPICLGGLSGCDSKPADGMLEEHRRSMRIRKQKSKPSIRSEGWRGKVSPQRKARLLAGDPRTKLERLSCRSMSH